MVEVTPLESKIIKQVEYYFGDVNLSRDKFLREAIKQNDGWVSMDTMLKFKRLKSLSEDAEFIKKSLSKSDSGLIEVGADGVRRNPELKVPETLQSTMENYKDNSVYVKGFNSDEQLDVIIEWLEKHGGKTLDVHMRRYPRDKKFKGSVSAIFEKKEDADKFLASEEAATFKDKEMTRLTQSEYRKRKQEEKDAKLASQAKRQAAFEANQEAQLNSRMIPGALLEITGLPEASKKTTEAKSDDAEKPNEKEETEEKEKESTEADSCKNGHEDEEMPSVMNLKQWLAEKLDSSMTVGWIDIEPAEGKAIVRFKQPNTAEKALAKLKEASGGDDCPVKYMNSELSFRVLTGDEEKERWKVILAAQQHKAQKRRGSGRGGGRHMANKRRRTN
uniref:HTH La-type RNA-binding domain-containing protein n=1 Tax=Trichobilharzia regenti TaxID=157069 RepID=A0AA85JLX8_TRIRE|nr:unnamed protein product [Trichobilharzia regenti]